MIMIKVYLTIVLENKVYDRNKNGFRQNIYHPQSNFIYK